MPEGTTDAAAGAARDMAASLTPLSSLFTPLPPLLLPLFRGALTVTSAAISAEVIFAFFAFGLSAASHVGYASDLLLVVLVATAEWRGAGVEARLAGPTVLRLLWRSSRLVSTLLAAEGKRVDAADARLSMAQGEAAAAQWAPKKAEAERDREAAARRQVEETLSSYKEEVDTLNEALRLAALDIADLGAEDDADELLDDDSAGALSGDEHHDHDHEHDHDHAHAHAHGDDDKVRRSGTARDALGRLSAVAAGRRTAVDEEAQDAAAEFGGGRGVSLADEDDGEGARTFIVKPDGTFRYH